MTSCSKLHRIGIVDQASAGWSAGASYTKMLAYSLGNVCQEAGVELCLFSQSQNDPCIEDERVQSIQLATYSSLPGEMQLRRLLRLPSKSRPFRGETRLRRLLRLSDDSNVFDLAHNQSVSVILPLLDVPPWSTPVKTIGWVPDFQHIYLPDFFSSEERAFRNTAIRRLTDQACLIMLSSKSALEHFSTFSPDHAHKARVVPFPSLFAFEPLLGDPLLTLKHFHLPRKFALVTNQFWAHKNHSVVVEAISQLIRKNVHIPVVMTGLPLDRRDPSNRYLSRLLQTIASSGLNGKIIILGRVEFSDLVNLMRSAAVVIQPSLFEGWSTVVEDAKALGRPLLCSDLPIHREQAPQAIGFFPCDRPDVLANLLAKHWDGVEPGPDLEAEKEALIAEKEFARLHGLALLRMCQECFVA